MTIKYINNNGNNGNNFNNVNNNNINNSYNNTNFDCERKTLVCDPITIELEHIRDHLPTDLGKLNTLIYILKEYFKGKPDIPYNILGFCEDLKHNYKGYWNKNVPKKDEYYMEKFSCLMWM